MLMFALSCALRKSVRMAVLGHIKDPSLPVSCLSQLPKTDAWSGEEYSVYWGNASPSLQ